MCSTICTQFMDLIFFDGNLLIEFSSKINFLIKISIFQHKQALNKH